MIVHPGLSCNDFKFFLKKVVNSIFCKYVLIIITLSEKCLARFFRYTQTQYNFCGEERNQRTGKKLEGDKELFALAYSLIKIYTGTICSSVASPYNVEDMKICCIFPENSDYININFVRTTKTKNIQTRKNNKTNSKYIT